MATRKTSKGTVSKAAHQARRNQSAKIQKALYEIADATSAVTDMQSFYKRLHEIVGKLMYAGNFFIATYDEQSGLLSFPYWVDEMDPPPPTGPLADFHGMTSWIIRTGYMGKRGWDQSIKLIASGEIELVGTLNEDGILAPLKMEGKVIGVVAVQSYTKGIEYSDEDEEVLYFVAQHIAIALTRARAIEETRQRNREIAEALEQQTATSEILSVIARSPTDVQPVFDAIVERAVKLCGGIYGFAYRVVGVQIYLAAQNSATKDFPVEVQELSTHFPMPLDTPETESNVAPVIRNCAMLHVADMRSDPRVTAYNREKARESGGGAGLYIPLVRDGKGIGAIYIEKTEAKPFTEKQIALVKTFADQAVIAIENVRLFTETQRLLKETEQRNSELAIINSVQAALAAQLDIHGIFDAVGEKLREIFSYQDVSIYSADLKTRLMTIEYSFEKGQKYERQSVPMNSLYEYFVTSNETFVFNGDFAPFAAQFSDYRIPSGELPKSCLIVPVPRKKDADTAVFLTLQDVDGKRIFTDSDVRLLQTLANSMSVALENARLFDETQRLLKETEQRNAELAIINSVQEGLASKLDMQAIYELVGDKIREIFDANTVVLATFDHEKNLMRCHYIIEQGVRYPIEQMPIPPRWTAFIQRGQTSLINNNLLEQIQQFEPDFKPSTGEIPKCALSVPLRMQGELRGVISLQNVDRENAFSDSDVRLLETLANSMSIALENARLFGETQRLLKETEQRAQELAIINSVQEGLASQLDIQAIFDLVGEKIGEIFNVNEVCISTYDRKTNLQYFPYMVQKGRRLLQDPLPLEEGIGFSPLVILKRQSIMINENMEERFKEVRSSLLGGAEMIRSMIYVPLVIGEEGRGLIAISSDHEHAFTDSDLRLLETLANSMSVALENARLFDEAQRLLKETEQRNAELAIINSVQAGLASQLDIQAIYNLVGDKIQEIFDAQIEFIGIYDESSGMMSYPYLIGRGKHANVDAQPLGGFSGQVMRSHEAVIVNQDMNKRSEEVGSTLLAGDENPKSGIYVPILAGTKAIGVISLQSFDRENAFTESDIRLLSTLASSLGIALESARLFDETQRLLKETEQRAQELAIINSVQEGLASKLDMQAIYDLVGDKIRDIFHNTDLSFIMHDPATNLLHMPYAFEYGKRWTHEPIPLPEYGFTAHVLRTGKTLVINENTAEAVKKYGGVVLSNSKKEESAVDVPLTIKYGDVVVSGLKMEKSSVRVPLVVGGQARGVITLEDMEREHAFSESDVRLLETLANSMSIALENARLWEQEKMYRKALQRELEIGREIQAGFLPEELPLVEGWEIAASLMSAREVAGDFYDAFELPDGNIGLVIADVCDKGVGAALFMTLFRSLIRAAANLDYFEQAEQANAPHSTSERLQRAVSLTNNYIAETHGKSGMFATLFFGILDPRDGKLSYINGGHEPPLIIQSGNVRETLHKTGPAVGAVMNPCFDIVETQLHAGDIFFAFTDGVPDCQDPHGESFGRERLLDVLRRDSGSSHGLVKAIETELHQYINSVTQFDDITLLAVRRSGTTFM